MFSHMAVMYANALYRRGLVREGYRVLDGIYRHCCDFATSRMYPGIPEYISARGRGMYPYLTGSASWLLLTLVTEVFGVKGILGDLALEPKLVAEQFDDQAIARITTVFAGRTLKIIYHNPARQDGVSYCIETVSVDGTSVPFRRSENGVLIERAAVTALDPAGVHSIRVELAPQKA